MCAEDAVLYSQSLSRLRSYQAGLDYRFEEGRAEGIVEGMEKGRMNALEEMARKMKDGGSDIDYISNITGLSAEDILNL